MRWRDMNLSEPFILGAPPTRYAVSCLECGALVIVPTVTGVPAPEAQRHHEWHQGPCPWGAGL